MNMIQNKMSDIIFPIVHRNKWNFRNHFEWIFLQHCFKFFFDTAPVYGAIEKELKTVLKKYPFKVVSKIPFVPVNDGKEDIAHFILNHIRSSQNNIGDSLDTLLFHRSEDLF